jgi:short-subunit dehydrogenase
MDIRYSTYIVIKNFYGTINLTDAILKNISNSGKIIFVGSMAGKITRLSEELKNKFRNPKLGRAQLYELMG